MNCVRCPLLSSCCVGFVVCVVIVIVWRTSLFLLCDCSPFRCFVYKSLPLLSSLVDVCCLWALLLLSIIRCLRYGRVRGVVMEAPVPPPAGVSPPCRAGPPQGGTDPRPRRPGRVDLPGRRRKPPRGRPPRSSLAVRNVS